MEYRFQLRFFKRILQRQTIVKFSVWMAWKHVRPKAGNAYYYTTIYAEVRLDSW